MIQKILYLIKEVDIINKYDTPEPWGTFFQDNATPQMEGLEELHNNIMFCLAIIIFVICFTIISIVINFKSKKSSYIGENSGRINHFIWTFSPALILILIAIPSFKLLYLMDEVIDPGLIIYGEGHDWYWNYQYPDFINTEENKIPVYNLAEDGSGLQQLNEYMPGMTEYGAYLIEHKGETLRSLGITIDRQGPYTRENLLTWYFHANEPGAFFRYDPDGTVINDYFVHRVFTLHYRKTVQYNYYNWK
jgi:hypothetical protein